MTLEQVYAAIGGDYKGVMERLPSADFVRRFALKFLQDDSFPNLKKALEEKDAPTAFRAAHTLKGVCQNLGFDALYVPSSALTEALRGGSLDGARLGALRQHDVLDIRSGLRSDFVDDRHL